ncbi:MAG: hypothetical protein WDA02_08405 [Saccharofermentanales bacterium]
MIKRYKSLGYDIDGKGYYDIDINDLPDNSHIKIDVICDYCGSNNNIKYYNYILNKKNNNGNYYCNKCKIDRITNTNLDKYGVKSTLLVDEFKLKRDKTMMDKYGTTVPLKNEKILKKFKETNIEKYGHDCSLLNKDIKVKTKNNLLEKFGVEHYSKTVEFKEKVKNKCLKKYGVGHYSKTQEFINKINKLTIDRNLKNKNLNILKIDNSNYHIKCDIKEHNYIIDKELLKNRIKYNTILCTICNPINSFSKSGKEIKLFNFIKENYNGEIIENTKEIIKPYELDIYLPELNLAFEFNGLYWHNELNKPNNYHKIKTDLCIEKNIQLIHIWEDDWDNKQEIIKSIILNKLNKTPNKIYARKCRIKDINDNNLIREFLNKNHIQGFVGSKIKIGLFYNNELVSLMTFGQLRKNMNSKSDSMYQYEMLRFCNKLNTNVIGGASKLFKYFINNYKPTQVISYADRSYSSGSLYKKLEFKFNSITDINYYYIIDNKRYYRFNFRKNILIKEGFDKNKTEHEIMLERKIYRIYNSGNLKFIFNI